MSLSLWPGGSLSFGADAVVLAVAAFPLAVTVMGALAWLRMALGVAPTLAWRRSFAEVGIVYGTVPWVWLTLIPGSGAGVVRGRVSLVPLRDLETMSDIQVVGNLLVLAAVGFCAPLLFAPLASVPRMVVVGAVCSATIESAQFLLQLDRVSSVDDVLLNTAGAGLAALASRPWWKRPVRRDRDDVRVVPPMNPEAHDSRSQAWR